MNDVSTVKEKLQKKSSRQMKIGVGLSIFSIAMFLTAVTSQNLADSGVIGSILIYICVLGIGVWKIIQSINIKKILIMFEEYKIRFTGSEDAYNIEYSNIAKVMDKNVDIVKKEVDKLIKYKLWESVYGGKNAIITTMLSNISVKCHSCGASLTVDMNNTKKMCEYCGASLADEIYEARYQIKK